MVKRKGAGGGRPKLVWDPAGGDRRLATAAEELRTGRYALAGELLATRNADEDLRDYRYLILAQVAVTTGVDAAWVAEEPGSPEAMLLRVRANVIRALQAHRTGHPKAGDLIEMAEAQCLQAAERFPRDPLPWVALLHLAPAARDFVPGPRELAVDGPWRTMGQLWQRDPWNREAHHRLLAAVGPKSGGLVSSVSAVALWITSRAPADSALSAVQLVAFIEAFRQQVERTRQNRALLAYRNWSTSFALQEAERCYTRWFAPAGGANALLPDLHLLAHALWAGSQREAAGKVFEAIGPYALTTPWSLHGNPEQVLVAARESCLSDP